MPHLWLVILSMTVLGLGNPAIAAVEQQISCTAEITDMVLTPGALVTCAIDIVGDVDLFRFSGSIADKFRISALNRGGPGTVCASLRDPGGANAGTWCNTVQEFSLQKDGTYTVVVTELADDQTVPYKLSLERIIPVSPSHKPVQFAVNVTDEINPDGDADFYTFSGSTGDQVRIQAANQAGPGTVCASLRDPGGTNLGTWCNSVQEFSLQKDGTFTMIVTELADDQTVTYLARLECLLGPCRAVPAAAFFTKPGVFRNGQWFLDDGNAQFDGCGTTVGKDGCVSFGLPGDIPVVGDWDGTGKIKIGVFRNGFWALDNGNGQFDGCGDFPAKDRCGTFGLSGDTPVVGDWDGSGKSRIGVYRNGEWYFDNGNLTFDGCGQFATQDRCGVFGLPGDVPKLGRWLMFP